MITPQKLANMIEVRDLWSDLIDVAKSNEDLKSKLGVAERTAAQSDRTIGDLTEQLRLSNELHAEYVIKMEREQARARKSIEAKDRALSEAAGKKDDPVKPLSAPLWLTRITITKGRVALDPMPTVSGEQLKAAESAFQHLLTFLEKTGVEFHEMPPQDSPWLIQPAPDVEYLDPAE